MLTDLNNTALVSGFREGDNRACSIIYNTWFPQLCFFTEQFTGNIQASQDIAAECFIKALHKKQDFESLEKLKAFLFVAAANAAKDYLRAGKRHNNSHEVIAQFSELSEQSIDEAYIRSEALHVIYAEIENLPAQIRQVIKLSFIEGKTLPEIASELGTAYKTIQNQKTRGLELLRAAVIKNKLVTITVVAVALSLLSEQTTGKKTGSILYGDSRPGDIIENILSLTIG